MMMMQTRIFQTMRALIGLACCAGFIELSSPAAEEGASLPEKQKKEQTEDGVNPKVRDMKPMAPRSFTPGTTVSDGFPVPSASSSTSRLTKEEAENLDRKKNWIFDNGDAANKNRTPEEAFGVKEFGVEKKETRSKTLMRAFMENGRPEGPNDSMKKAKRREKEEENDRKEAREDSGGNSFMDYSLGLKFDNTQKKDSIGKLGNEIDRSSLPIPLSLSKEMGTEKEIKSRHDLRMQQFNQLFVPKSFPGAAGGDGSGLSASDLLSGSSSRNSTAFDNRSLPTPVLADPFRPAAALPTAISRGPEISSTIASPVSSASSAAPAAEYIRKRPEPIVPNLRRNF
jgi:hypothetical protein